MAALHPWALATIVIDRQCVRDMSVNVIAYMKLHQNMSDNRVNKADLGRRSNSNVMVYGYRWLI